MDLCAVASESFIDCVIDDLIDEVVEATLTGRSDIHTWPLADRLKALEDGDRTGVVGHAGPLCLSPGREPGVRAVRSRAVLAEGAVVQIGPPAELYRRPATRWLAGFVGDANLVAGTVVIENVFYLPGLGRLIFQSIANRDLIVVRNGVMLLAVMVVAINFVVDLLYAVIDPRLQGRDSA